AETAGAITLYLSEFLGIPVSTTHTITGSIVGVGITKRVSAVRWGVTINLLWAWILTIPVSALIAALIYYVILLLDRKSTRLNSSHVKISYAVFCLNKKTEQLTGYV